MLTGYSNIISVTTDCLDADASAFINQNIANGGTLSNSEKTAINNLYLDLKGVGLNNSVNVYSKIFDFLPVIGGTANSLFLFGKSLTTGIVNGGVTLYQNKYKGNGTNGFIDLGVTPATIYGGTTKQQIGYGMQIITNPTNDLINYNQSGSGANSWFSGIQTFTNILYPLSSSGNGNPSYNASGNYIDLWAWNRTNSSNVQLYKGTTLNTSGTDSFIFNENTGTWVLSAIRYNGSAVGYTDSEQGFHFWCTDCNQTEIEAILISFNAFNTAIGR